MKKVKTEYEKYFERWERRGQIARKYLPPKEVRKIKEDLEWAIEHDIACYGEYKNLPREARALLNQDLWNAYQMFKKTKKDQFKKSKKNKVAV
jgi:hypothetical protein